MLERQKYANLPECCIFMTCDDSITANSSDNKHSSKEVGGSLSGRTSDRRA